MCWREKRSVHINTVLDKKRSSVAHHDLKRVVYFEILSWYTENSTLQL